MLITREMVRGMRQGAVIIDFAIDQGGSVETSRPATLRDQVYKEEGVLHHCVPNVTALVSRTASYAISNAALPYLLAVGEHGLPTVFAHSHSLARGVNLFQGRVVNAAVAAALGVPVDPALPAFILPKRPEESS
jgi:alanine dehydrogenase